MLRKSGGPREIRAIVWESAATQITYKLYLVGREPKWFKEMIRTINIHGLLTISLLAAEGVTVVNFVSSVGADSPDGSDEFSGKYLHFRYLYK